MENTSSSRPQSQISGHLSEASTSNKAPNTSPLPHTAQQNRTMSTQSLNKHDYIATGQINGKIEDGDLKFERLKDLPEETLLPKVQELVAYLQRMEEYHRGDGMRVQKMLGDMYWDYTSLRETIGDALAKEGYAGASMKMLKTLNSIGIFKNDDVWFPTYYAYNTLWNFSDASSKLAQSLAENDAVRLLTLNCGHKPYLSAIHSKNVYYVLKASLSILHNIAKNPSVKHLFEENKTSEIIMPFIKSEDEMLKILAMLTLAYIVDEEDNSTLIDDTGVIKCVVNWIDKALDQQRRRYKGFTPTELTEGLDKLAVNDKNKMKIIEEGALPLFIKMLQTDDVHEQSACARCIWTLSFDKDARKKIVEFPELVQTLEKFTDSANKNLQKNASGALWILNGENEASKAATRPKSAAASRTKGHIFLSYSWSDKEIAYQIRDRLRAEGYAIWIDVERMGGSTLEAMADGIENSAVVLICMSEKYKQSPNCRTEGEYTFQLRKEYIPLMMQKKYRPDGWLGAILGAKLYFDFSGKYPLEKSFQGLLKELRGRGQVTPGNTPTGDSTDGPLIQSSSTSNHASPSTPSHHHTVNNNILNMGQEEVAKWLRTIKLNECIPTFNQFDGKLLLQLRDMRQEAPEFFYQCLEKKLNMSLIEILKFTKALEELH
ncbi:hypothetical protein CHS0354_025478 [Potamilus streckersoni]|uniref:TIR domain-containing protein n=1 Tax=Potamilus streckersoni TaxID=2493646 RepID=A0AAE0VHT0_9BIVA|nr:hypothetical protein CHS0354_025478 [Potamilus streckersoni]